MGQSHYIGVPIDLAASDALSDLYRDFAAAHQRRNGHKTGAPAKIVNLRVVQRAHRPPVSVGAKAPAPAPASKGRSLKGRRSVWFSGETARVEGGYTLRKPNGNKAKSLMTDDIEERRKDCWRWPRR